ARAVKADETLCPLDVASLGARRVVANAQCPPQPVEQARRLGKGQFAQIDPQQPLVEERQRFAGFFETAKRIFLRLGEMIEKTSHVGKAKFAWMADAMKEDEAACPVGEALAGLRPAEVGQRGLTELIEQTRRLADGKGGQRIEGGSGPSWAPFKGRRGVGR